MRAVVAGRAAHLLVVVGQDRPARGRGPTADAEHRARGALLRAGLLGGPIAARGARLVGDVEVLRELRDVAEALPRLARARDQRLAADDITDDPLLQRRELAAGLLLAVLEPDDPLTLDRRRALFAAEPHVSRRRARPRVGLHRPALTRATADRGRSDVRRRALADLEHVPAVRALHSDAAGLETGLV